jgi:hypothetical protein
MGWDWILGWSSVQLRSELRASSKEEELVLVLQITTHPFAHGDCELVALLSCARVCVASPVTATVLDLDRVVKAGDRSVWVGDRRWIGRYLLPLLAVKSAPRLCGQSRLFRAIFACFPSQLPFVPRRDAARWW